MVDRYEVFVVRVITDTRRRYNHGVPIYGIYDTVEKAAWCLVDYPWTTREKEEATALVAILNRCPPIA
jgi:hypothetical protein